MTSRPQFWAEESTSRERISSFFISSPPCSLGRFSRTAIAQCDCYWNLCLILSNIFFIVKVLLTKGNSVNIEQRKAACFHDSFYCVISTRYVERILDKIENSFNVPFAG